MTVRVGDDTMHEVGNDPDAVARAAVSDWWVALLVAGAGLAGAAGVALAAVAAHRVASAAVAAAAQILMIHAAAVVGIVAVALRMAVARAWLGVASLMLAGAVLFGSDVALSGIAGVRLFPMAAPTGGSMLMAAWVALAAVGLWDRRPV